MFLVGIIPFHKVMVTYAITLWIISAIALMMTNKNVISHFKIHFGLAISLLMYLSFVAGVFYSNNMPSALFDIQVKSSLFIIPPVIYLLRDFYTKNFKYILMAFVIANIVAGLVCLLLACYRSLQFFDGFLHFNSKLPGIYADLNTKPPSYFAYTYFSVFKHPAYFSMYLVLCVFIVIYFLRNSLNFITNASKNKILYIAAIIFLVFIIYLLESKAAYVALLLLCLIYGISYVVKKRKWIVGIVMIAVILIISMIGFKQNSRFYYINSAFKNKDGFIEAVQSKNYKVLIDTYGIDRIPIWLISSDIIRDNLLAGVGSGDVSDCLMQKYKEYKLQTLENNRYNTHNQYLETFMAIGLIGFLIFLLWLFYPLIRNNSYTKEGFLVSVFIGIVCLNFLFETALNTIAGVIFVAFFYSFLLFVPNKISKINKT